MQVGPGRTCSTSVAMSMVVLMMGSVLVSSLRLLSHSNSHAPGAD